jgi:hypothetical protein
MERGVNIEISPDVLFQEISGETVLLDLKSESYFGLDKTATRIWQLLQDQKDLEAIFNIMVDEFDVDPEVLRKDLQTHVQELETAGLITFRQPE